MHPNPTLSVVMPVSNAREWLVDAVGSIRSQTLSSWELILVLDVPTDGSDELARGLAEQDDRIVVIELDAPAGAGSARNVGLRSACGEYVVFADADDLVPADAYERLVASAERTGSDIISGSAEQFDQDGTVRTYWTVDDQLWSEGRESCAIADTPQLAYDHTPWNKVFRRAWLVDRRVEFPTSTTCEDLAWWARAVVDARVDIVPGIVYRHRRHGASVTARISRGQDLSDWITQTETMVAIYAAAGLDRSVQLIGKRLLLREAWTRVRGLGVLDLDGRRQLEDFVGWMSRWLSATEFDALSCFPRTCYRLLLRGRADLASAVVSCFDAPSPNTSERWWRIADEVARAVDTETPVLSSELWRERMFAPVLDAAQRGESLPVTAPSVTGFWDALCRSGDVQALASGEMRALAALRVGAITDVGLIRRLRRTRAVARRTRGSSAVFLEGRTPEVTVTIVSDENGERTVLGSGHLGPGQEVLLPRRLPKTAVFVEVPLSSGEPLRIAVRVDQPRLGRAVRAVARAVGRRVEQ